MLSSGSSAFGNTGDEAEEVYLNLMPMIDILTCLLFFLLISFGAVLIALINASTPVLSEADSEANYSKTRVTMGVHITEKGFLATGSHDAMTEEELKVLKRVFPKKDGAFDYEGLHEYLWGIKKQYPDSSTIILTPEAEVPYEVLVGVMDASRDRAGGTKRRPILVPMFPEAVVSTIVQ